MTITMLHTEPETTCPIVDNAPTNYHFEMRCEDCDVLRLAWATLGTAVDLYHAGRITQDEFEAYMHVWASLSPSGSRPEWRTTPTDPTVRRVARKLLRARGHDVHAELLDDAPAGGGQR